MTYDIEKAKKDAIASFKTKQQAVLKDVEAGKYTTQWFKEEMKDYSLEIFQAHCERILHSDYPVQINILTYKCSYLLEAARYYVALEKLIARLINGEDPRLLLLEVLSNE